MMKLIFKILILVTFVNDTLLAQWSVSGTYPRTLPNNAQYAKSHLDTASGRMFHYKSPKWYLRGVVVAATSPNDTSYFVSGVGTIIVSYQNLNCQWYNTATQSYWKWTGTAWQNQRSFNLDSLLIAHNRWTGKNTFADSLTTEKGIKSGGLIDTKGLNTEGSSTTAAATLKGVQADKDTVVTTNFTIDGRYGTVGFDCTSGFKNCTFPSTSGTTDWKFIIRKDDNSANDLVIKTSSGTEFYRIKSKMTVIFKNINGTFKRIQ